MEKGEKITVKKKMGVEKGGKIRRDVINPQKWVFEVYYADKIAGKTKWRNHPNFISPRYLSKTSASKSMMTALTKGSSKISWNDEVRRRK